MKVLKKATLKGICEDCMQSIDLSSSRSTSNKNGAGHYGVSAT